MKNLFLGLILFAPFFAKAQLLENPGFESGDEGWLIKNPSAAAVMAEAAHDGKLGLRLHFKGDGERAHIDTEKLPVEGGKIVKLSFWARTSGNQTGGVGLLVFNSSKKPLAGTNGKPLVMVGIRNSPDWTLCVEEFTLPEEAALVVLAIRSWSGDEGTIDMDDFELSSQ